MGRVLLEVEEKPMKDGVLEFYWYCKWCAASETQWFEFQYNHELTPEWSHKCREGGSNKGLRVIPRW
jgi:hypothetical protein